jgi:hypothetical protein
MHKPARNRTQEPDSRDRSSVCPGWLVAALCSHTARPLFSGRKRGYGYGKQGSEMG